MWLHCVLLSPCLLLHLTLEKWCLDSNVNSVPSLQLLSLRCSRYVHEMVAYRRLKNVKFICSICVYLYRVCVKLFMSCVQWFVCFLLFLAEEVALRSQWQRAQKASSSSCVHFVLSVFKHGCITLPTVGTSQGLTVRSKEMRNRKDARLLCLVALSAVLSLSSQDHGDNSPVFFPLVRKAIRHSYWGLVSLNSDLEIAVERHN